MTANHLDRKMLKRQVQQALKNFQTPGGDDHNLLAALLLVQQARVKREAQSPSELRAATNDVLEDGITQISGRDPVLSEILQRRFIEDETVRMIAPRLRMSVDQVQRRQNLAIEALTDMLIQAETAQRESHALELEGALPSASYSQLFGFDEARRSIVERMLDGDRTWVLAITGIGGIGKTSLADAVTRELIRTLTFSHILWVRIEADRIAGNSVTPERLTDIVSAEIASKLFPDQRFNRKEQRDQQIRMQLKQAPWLVVIDNIETRADTAHLMTQLADWSRPTKFIVTTRARHMGAAEVHTHWLNELAAADSNALLRFHATQNNLPELAAAPDNILEKIYEVTGGNPLALKLVVGLLSHMSLPDVLADLQQSREGRIEAMYRRIYLQAWQSLTEGAQDLLLTMPLVGDTGGTVEQLRGMSELSAEATRTAITELASRSLLEVRGDLFQRRYGIHRLTATFLQTEIIHWPTEF